MSSQLDCENSEVRIRKETEIGLGLISQMKSIVPHLVPIDDLVVIVDKNYKRTDVIFYARFKLFCHLSFTSSPNKVVSSSCFLSRFGLRYVEARWRRVVVWPGNSYHSTNGSDSQALYVSITSVSDRLGQ